jgi:hypothetical protein
MPHGLKESAALVAVILAVGLGACSDAGNGPSSSPANRATTSDSAGAAKPSLTREQLRAMMPTRVELGLPRWGVMAPAERVEGFMDNRRAAEETELLNVSRADLDAAGRVSGYIRYFWDGGCGGTCIKALLDVHAEIHVFRDAEAASRFVENQAAGYPRLEGKPLHEHARFASVETFSVGDIGHDGVGVRYVLALHGRGYEGLTIRETLVLFRVDRLVGVASAASLNQKNPAPRALATARILERRTEDVVRTQAG